LEDQAKQRKEIVILVEIGVFEENYSSGCDSSSPLFTIPKKNGISIIIFATDSRKFNLLLKHVMSPISYYKDWRSWYDPFNESVYLCLNVGLKYGLLSHQGKF
jgi:hypothetical protein